MDTRGKVGGDRYRGGTVGIKIRVIRVWGTIAAGSSTTCPTLTVRSL